MLNTNQESFEVFCQVYDEFNKQSKGRISVEKSLDIAGLLDSDMSPRELHICMKELLSELERSPSFYFYRGHFFWHVRVREGALHAYLIQKDTGGLSPLERSLRWSVATLNPERVVKNLLSIMRSHEVRLVRVRRDMKVSVKDTSHKTSNSI